MASTPSLLSRVFQLLLFRQMPIRRKFYIFSTGVAFWFLLLGAIALQHVDRLSEVITILVTLLLALALLVAFGISITRSFTAPIASIIRQMRTITQGHFDGIERLRVTTGDEIGELIARFNVLLDSLTELSTFKKVIEEDDNARDVYARLGRIFAGKGLPMHRFYETRAEGAALALVYGSPAPEGKAEPWCSPEVTAHAGLCRAKKTGTAVSSVHYPEICKHFTLPGHQHLCVPLLIGGTAQAVAQFVEPHTAGAASTIEARVDTVLRFIKEALPVLEAKRLTDALRESAVRDPLTGLHNRRFLEETQARLVAIAERGQARFGLLMIDVDHFKQVNDRHGHAAGDMVLRELGPLLTKSLRGSDIILRYGGEEILVILHDAETAQLLTIAERLRLAVEGHRFITGDGSLQVTVSVGVAELPTDGCTFERCIQCADAALYRAKAAGRNRVARFDPSMAAEAAATDPTIEGAAPGEVRVAPRYGQPMGRVGPPGVSRRP